jgi:hypothetical protein
MKIAFKCKKVVSRKQWRYLKLLLDDLGETEYDLKRCEYTKTELVALLSVDYDALPERSSDPDATPRDKSGLVPAECACGCRTVFVSKNKKHIYAASSHRKAAPKSAPKAVPKAAPKAWATMLGMSFLVDPALDRYETRELVARGTK